MRIKKNVSVLMFICSIVTAVFALEHTYESLHYTGTVNMPLFGPFGEVENTEKLVNLSSGNLGLGMALGSLDVGNDSVYTIILGYNSGIPLNHQASWVGLGFSINPGAIIRSVAAIPDDKKNGAYQTFTWSWQDGQGLLNQVSGGFSYSIFVDQTTLPSSGITYGPQGLNFYVNLNRNSPYPTALGNNILAVPPASYGISPGTSSAFGFSAPIGSGTLSEVYYKYGMMWEHLTTNSSQKEYSGRSGISPNLFMTGSPPHPNVSDKYHNVFRTLHDVTEGVTAPPFAFTFSSEANDNYLVQGPAPTGLMHYDKTCQIALGPGPSWNVYPSPSDPNPPSNFGESCGERGFFYTTRRSINSDINPNLEKEQQGIKVTHETDPDGRISKIIITDMQGIKYYYAKPIKVDDITNIASISNASYSITDDFDGYTTSWLLTAIIYPEFIDAGTQFTGLNYDALKEAGDKGGYVAFYYTDTYTDFEYRSPNIDDGTPFPYYSSCPPIRDNTAEMFAYCNSAGKINYPYLSKIETPKMWADFTISDRYDAIETFPYLRSPSGKTSRRKLKKLDNIKIFTKVTNALVRQIDFNYDYSLAKGSYLCSAENSDKGRLTLKDLTITNKGRAYPKVLFNYTFNPRSDKTGITYGQSILWDRWGYYKSDAQWDHSAGTWNHFTTSLTDASAWSLTSLKTSSGLQIGFTYEADDYGFVGNYKPLSQRGTATRYGASQFNSWTTVDYKLGPDIRVKEISLQGPNIPVNNQVQFIYSTNVNDKVSNRTNTSGVVTDETPSFSRPENVDYNDIDYGYYQPWRCNIGQRYAAQDNYGFKHVYEMVHVYYPGGKYKKIYKYIAPKGSNRPFAYKYSNIDVAPALWDSWIIDYRPAMMTGLLSEIRNYRENSGGTFNEVSSVIYDYGFSVNAAPNVDMRYFKTSYTSTTHRTKVIERRPESAGSWNYDHGGDPGDGWGCNLTCDYPPCSGSGLTCDYDWGSTIYYGSIILKGWSETKNGVTINYSHVPLFDILSGTDRLTGQTIYKNVSGGGLPSKSTQFVFNRASYFTGKNILTTVAETRNLKNNLLSTHTKSNFGVSAYGNYPYSINTQQKTVEKTLRKDLNDGVATGTITDADYLQQNTLTIFDPYNKQIETKNVNNVYSVNIFDNFPKSTSAPATAISNRVIASVKNTGFFECGVYTCDYDANPGTGFLDQSNGWERGQSNKSSLPSPEVTLVTTPVHFGEQCVKVKHAFGPSKNFHIYEEKDYVLSAWIKPVGVPVEKNKVIGADYRKLVSSTVLWPIDLVSDVTETPVAVSGTLKVIPKSDGWYYVELPITAKTDLPASKWLAVPGWGVHIWVGAPDGPSGAYVCIDDIRFYPQDAVVETQYYDKTYRNSVIAEVDANNSARYTKYDEFDRVIETKNNNKELTSSKTYNP